MILLGAGSSVPFDVPGMEGFTKRFIAEKKDLSGFICHIAEAINQSKEILGFELPFDLETLLAVLNDLSGSADEKPISIPTASLLLKETLSIKAAREKYGDQSQQALVTLREFMFDVCMQPIDDGRKSGHFQILNSFYGPLMTILNRASLRSLQQDLSNIYSTNWDLCFKTWADYVNIRIDDGTNIDRGLPIFEAAKFGSSGSSPSQLNYVPLHGSLDLVTISRPKGAGIYRDIQKVVDPLGYFKGRPDNIKNIFMIYPLEAIGYEESVRSPYLDLLDHFKTSLRRANFVFVIGYSLRDPTIGSIFEEVIAERIRDGDLSPLPPNPDSRKEAAAKHNLKIAVINPSPEKLAKNLKKQSQTNLLQTFVPIRIRFPSVADKDFGAKYAGVLRELLKDLETIGYLTAGGGQRSEIIKALKSDYNLALEKPEMVIK
jgi:hypothetical protein